MKEIDKAVQTRTPESNFSMSAGSTGVSSMSLDHSITFWIRRLSKGDAAAVEPIWRRFFRRMTGLAHKRLSSTTAPQNDDEDVALSAFHQFCQAALANRFPNITGRQELWQLLATLTTRKAIDHYRAASAQKRSPGEAAQLHENIVDLAAKDPALEVMLADEIRSLFKLLERDSLQDIAERKLNGYSNEEIAKELGCTVRTVTRRVSLIRDIWRGEAMNQGCMA